MAYAFCVNESFIEIRTTNKRLRRMKLMLTVRNRHHHNGGHDLFRGLTQLRQELDRMFDLTGDNETGRVLGIMEGQWSPRVDVHEDSDKVLIYSEIPGVKKEDIELMVQGDTLIIRGERKANFDTTNENQYHRLERLYGAFHRAITLPKPVEAGKVAATYKDGILEVVLPKREEAKPRQIEIK
jgi:HSP20 family protein